jgi:hypothetical protein
MDTFLRAALLQSVRLRLTVMADQPQVERRRPTVMAGLLVERRLLLLTVMVDQPLVERYPPIVMVGQPIAAPLLRRSKIGVLLTISPAIPKARMSTKIIAG